MTTQQNIAAKREATGVPTWRDEVRQRLIALDQNARVRLANHVSRFANDAVPSEDLACAILAVLGGGES